jgi:sulfate permease, SulP family
MRFEPPVWRDDLPAALIVGCLLLPQSLAYALLAGLPPVAGVMASSLPLIAYALFGSSRTLAVGPVAVLALMTATAVAPLAERFALPAHTVALVLSLEIAGLLLVAALLRLDALASLLSAPVLHGFVSGAAVAIALGQVPKLLGLSLPGSSLLDWTFAVAHAPAHSLAPVPAALALGGGALVLLLGLRRAASKRGTWWVRLAPVMVLALAVGVVMVLESWAPQHVQGLQLTGAVRLSEGLQFTPAWRAPGALWLAALPAAGLMALVAYVESLAVAKSLAARRGERVLPRRELLGLAAANAAAGCVGGQPVTGGLARSGLAFEAGARTRWAGAFTAIVFVALVGGASPFLARLPHAVLAAVVMVAVLPLVDVAAFVRAWRYAPREALLMGAVALLTVGVNVESALAVGVAGSLVLLLQRTARPHWAELGRLPGTDVFRNVKRFAVERQARLLLLRVDEGICFSNARWFSDMLWTELGQRPQVRHLVLVMSGVNDIDLSGLEALMQFARQWQVRSGRLDLCELKGPVSDRLQTAGLADWLPGQVHRSTLDAWQAARASPSVADGPQSSAEPLPVGASSRPAA